MKEYSNELRDSKILWQIRSLVNIDAGLMPQALANKMGK